MSISYSVRRLRRYPIVWWVLVICVAAMTGFTVTTSLYAAQTAARQYGGLTTVAVLKRPLPVGTVLEADDVRTESRPRAFLSDVPVVSKPIGRTLTQPGAAGDVVNENNAGPAGASATAALVPTGQRAIAVSLHGSHPNLQVGDTVDAIATAAEGAASAEPAVVVARAARIVDVNDDRVMIAIPEELATRVAFASTHGTLVLALNGSSAAQ